MSTNEPKLRSPSIQVWLLPALVFFIAFLFRLVGIAWGLPNDLRNWSLHPDEDVNVLVSQQIEPAKLDFDPGFYNYGTLYLTVLKVAGDVVNTYAGGVDPQSVDSVVAGRKRTILAGRVISAACGSGLALTVFLILRRRTHDVGAAFGAGWIAFAPALVMHSRFATVDMLATLLLAISAAFALKRLDIDEAPAALKLSILSGVFAGLSAGTKYNGILGLLTLIVVLFASRKPTAWKETALATLSAAFAFLIATPGVLVNTEKFSQDFLFELTKSGQGQGLIYAYTTNGFVFQFTNLLVGAGFALVFLGLFGVGWLCRRKQIWMIALLVFFLVYFLVIGRAEVKFVRYVFPLSIALACGFGWLIGRAHEKSERFRAVVIVGIMALGGVDPGGFRVSAMNTQWMVADDPRDRAGRELIERAKQTSLTVGLVSDPWYWSASLFPDAGIPRMARIQDREEIRAQTTTPRVMRYIPVEGIEQRQDWDVRLITELQPDLITYSSFESGPVQRLSELSDLDSETQVVVDRYRQFMEKLKEAYSLDRLYGVPNNYPHDMAYIQPLVAIWKRKE
jgi:hypothetical protein